MSYDETQTMSFKSALSTDLTATLARNTAYQLNLSRRGQNARLTFAGTAGEGLTLRVSGQSTVPADRSVIYRIYKPDGSHFDSFSADTGSTRYLPVLPVTGIYVVTVDPYYGATASAQVLLATGITGTLPIGGAATSVTTTVPGQGAYLSFTATAGQHLGLGISDLVLTDGTYAGVSVTVYDPAGRYFASSTCGVNYGCDFNIGSAVAGKYTVAVTPHDEAQTMSFKSTLSVDVAGTLARNTADNLALSRRGQNGRLTFAGTAGERLTLQVSGQSTAPVDQYVTYTIYKPDGSHIDSFSPKTGQTRDLPLLPVTGTYVVHVDPYYGATASAQVKLSSGITGTVAIGGGATSMTTLVPGQGAYLNFTVTAGQHLGLGITDLVLMGGTDTSVSAVVYDPAGRSIGTVSCSATYVAACDLNIGTTVAGTYTIAVTPRDQAQTISFKGTLSADMAATLSRNTAYQLILSRRGQNGRLTFTGTAGERLTLQVSGQHTVPVDQYVNYTIYQPDGRALYAYPNGQAMNLAPLPVTGTYVVFVDPKYGVTAGAQVKLATGATGTMPIGGGATTVTTSIPGQFAYLSFTATAGQNLGLGISDIVLTGGTNAYVNVDIRDPAGNPTAGNSCYVNNAGCDFNIGNAIAGVYSVQVWPTDEQTMSFKSTLSADVVATLVRNTAYNLSLSRRGQNGRLTFAGTAGERLTLQVSGQGTVPVNKYVTYTIYKPDGGHFDSFAPQTGQVKALPVLPSSGTYVVFADPNDGATASAQVKLVVTP